MQDVTNALTNLHTRLIDSADGYAQALDSVESHTHAEIFREMKTRRERNAAELRTYLADRGVSLDDDGSILAAAHRAFLQLKSTLGSDDAAVLEEVIRGEETLLEAYNDAIEPAGAQTPELDFLTKQYQWLSQKVEDLKSLRRSAAA